MGIEGKGKGRTGDTTQSMALDAQGAHGGFVSKYRRSYGINPIAFGTNALEHKNGNVHFVVFLPRY